MAQRRSRQRKAAHIPVYVFGRVPMVGVGKTRLAGDIGVIAAWRFQRDCLAKTRRTLGAGTCLTPDRYARGLKQGQGGFGERLLRLLQREPMIVIGSDVPDLTPTDIAAARQALKRPGLVLGPSPDGGFWLIGWRGKRLPARLFNAVRWSSEHTLADVLRNAPTARLIHNRRDVDRGSDLEAPVALSSRRREFDRQTHKNRAEQAIEPASD